MKVTSEQDDPYLIEDEYRLSLRIQYVLFSSVKKVDSPYRLCDYQKT
jgi:hypothetical protein